MQCENRINNEFNKSRRITRFAPSITRQELFYEFHNEYLETPFHFHTLWEILLRTRKEHAFQASIATTFVDFAFFVFKKRASKTSTFCCACGLIYNMFASISRPSSYGFAAGCPISGEPRGHRCRKGVPQKGGGD